MNLLSAMLSEDGTPQSVSTMRVAVLLVVLFVLAPRVVTTLKTGVAPALSYEEVGMVLGALGVKAWQRGKEENHGDTEAQRKEPAKAGTTN